MGLTRIEPDSPGKDLRTFECGQCQHIETMVTAFADADWDKSRQCQPDDSVRQKEGHEGVNATTSVRRRCLNSLNSGKRCSKLTSI